jgi:hypothetical protein
MNLIEQFTSLRLKGSGKKSIGGITVRRAKRTRAQVQREWDLLTKVGQTQDQSWSSRSRLIDGHQGKRKL